MPRFMVETFVAPGAHVECTAREWRVRSATGELRRQGLRVRLDRVVAAPEDGLCRFVFDAASGRETALVVELAQLDQYRIVEASEPERTPDVG